MPDRFYRSLALVGLLTLATGPALEAGEFNDAQYMHMDFPAWFKESFLNLREDVDEAGEAGKVGLMVLFTTEGCSYCAEFIRRSLGDPGLASLVQAHFDAVGLEIFSDAEMVDPSGNETRVKQFAEDAGAGFAPTLLFYGEGGRLIYRGVGYHSPERFRTLLDFLIGGHHERTSFRDYVGTRTTGAAQGQTRYRLRPDPLFSQPPYALDRSRASAQHPLLVIFEGEGCGDCEALHDEVLALPEVRELLHRFEVVRLDAGDAATPVVTPEGTRTTAAAWYAETGFSRLPAFLFFEENGKEVLRTDAMVLRQRMMNSLQYALERAYEKQWTYQRFARSKSMERAQREREPH
jgi:thioredoxin-related protein